MKDYLFTSESVTEGHPDKMCDQISDAILDEILSRDPSSRVACETLATTGLILVTGEITTSCYVDIEKTVRETVKNIGYDRAKYGFDCDTCAVLVSLSNQSSDIAQGVDRALTDGVKDDVDELELVGAGDQGMMFGYACDETSEYMPLPISLAHKLTKRLSEVRKLGILPYLRPDGKSQVTVEYVDGVPKYVTDVVISTQHGPDVDNETIREDIIKNVIKHVIPEELLKDNVNYFINPTGRFVIGGPAGDSGLTGRKIIVDTYGGYARHGGGAFSGKDPTKVDRSAAYMSRYIAKNIVAAKLAKQCEIEVSYAIGIANPISVNVNTHGTGVISDSEIIKIINDNFDLRPAAIIKNFNLQRPIYKQTAAYGHFGRDDLDLPWEKLDKVSELSKYLNK